MNPSENGNSNDHRKEEMPRPSDRHQIIHDNDVRNKQEGLSSLLQVRRRTPLCPLNTVIYNVSRQR
jgi:hypothetical protein